MSGKVVPIRPQPDNDPACDWCGEFEDVAGPLEGVLCGDGSTVRLCEDCLEGRCND